MPRHFEKRIVPFAAPQMFALVSDVERYPEFLPWCLACDVLQKDGHQFKAELQVGYKAFRDRFISQVTLKEPTAILVEYGGGALSHLRNEWSFTPLSQTSSRIDFFVDFEVRSRLLGVMMELFFDTAFRKMASAFEARAQTLYGKEPV